MKEKMNLADGPNDSNSDDEGVVHRKDSKLSTQVQTDVRTGSGESSVNSAAKMINVDNVDNALAEDKEIHSDSEEEEE